MQLQSVSGNLFFLVAFIHCIFYYIVNFSFTMQILSRNKIFSVLKEIFTSYFQAIFLYSMTIRITVLLSGMYSIYGDILAMLFLLAYNFIACISVLSNVAKAVNATNSKKTNDTSYNLFLSSIHFVLFLFFTISLILFVLNRFQDSSIKKNILFTFFSILCFVKFVGNFATKLGDVIADYRNKVLNNTEEDQNSTVFDYLDNIGDVIGDMLSNFVDLFMLTILMMCCINLNINYDDYIHKSFTLIGKLATFFLSIAILQTFVSYKKLFNFVDYIFILNGCIWILVDSLRRNMTIWSIKSFSLKSMHPDLSYLMFFVIIVILLDLTKKLNVYQSTYKTNKEYYESIGSYCLLHSFGVSLFLTIKFLFLSYLLGKIVSSIYGTFDFSEIMLGPILWQYLFLFSCYYFWKSCIGVIADSTGGFLEKIKIQRNEQNLSCTNLQESIDTLEEHDQIGNISKLETRVFLCTVFFVTIVANVKTYGFLLAVYFIIFVLITLFIRLWRDFSNNQKITYSEIFNRISRQCAFFINTFCIVMARLVVQSKIYPIWHENIISIIYCALCISLLTGIYGGLLDIYKKYSKEDRVSDVLKKAFVQHDILGDFLKDVLSPILYTISVLSLYIFLCFQ